MKVHLEAVFMIQEAKKQIEDAATKIVNRKLWAKLWDTNQQVKCITEGTILLEQNNDLIKRGAVFIDFILKKQQHYLSNVDNALITSFLKQQKLFESKNQDLLEQQAILEGCMKEQSKAIKSFREIGE